MWTDIKNYASPKRPLGKTGLTLATSAVLLACGAIKLATTAPSSALAQVAIGAFDEPMFAAPRSEAATITLGSPSEPTVRVEATTPSTQPARTEQGGTLAPTSHAQLVLDGLDSRGRLVIAVNRSATLSTLAPYKRVSVATPDIADVNTVTGGQLLVTAKKVGNTQLVVWDEADNSQTVELQVEADLSGLVDQLKKQMPGVTIEASATANGAIVLRGRVPDLIAAQQAAALAGPYGKVINLLEVIGGQQVQLQVRFMEVSRSATSALGVDLSSAITSTEFDIGFNSNNGLPNGDRAGVLTASGNFGDFAFDAFVDALKRNNLARTLAEPNLSVTSGEEGKFLAGGEVPIPVPQVGVGGGSTITIEYKEFGVGLKCVPIVLGDGRVRLKIGTEVSELDYSKGTTVNGTSVPGVNTRNVNTVVEMAEGQTFMLGGLLSHKTTAFNQSVPGLGEIPVLGALFRSVRFERSETELVILVTPRFVSPLDPDKVPQLPGQKWRYPNEAELFFLGDLGGPAKGAEDAPAPKFQGKYGFVDDESAPAVASVETK